MKTAEGPAKEFELDSGVANREPWKFPKRSDILGWVLLDRTSISPSFIPAEDSKKIHLLLLCVPPGHWHSV